MVTIPIEKPTFKKIPCARTLHGEAPAAETINNPSPNPNKANPKHKKKKKCNIYKKFFHINIKNNRLSFPVKVYN